MSSSNHPTSNHGVGGKKQNHNHQRPPGVDTFLTQLGKRVQTGQQVRLTLIKGPTYEPSPDPVHPSAPSEVFPLIAKFPESVIKPNFEVPPWNTARLYQQDVPKAVDDSDDEDAAAVAAAAAAAKKRWKRRKEAPKRQWILQENIEFLETQKAKLQRRMIPKDQISSRYEGFPEHNPSQYVLLEAASVARPSSTTNHHHNNHDEDEMVLHVTTLPTPHATITFSQPAARKTLTMSEAEQAIQDQRNNISRFMMHQNDKQRMLHGGGRPTNESKKRLFGKLQQNKGKHPGAGGGNDDEGGDDDDDDDIMGDLAFRNRKGTAARARKELLQTLGEGDLKVDPDGVIGGMNDSEFARGRKFGRFKAEKDSKEGSSQERGVGGDDTDAIAGGGGGASAGNDGMAMQDDFYQRDVQAEYEELDYDANEQFDDDDVDVGETEVTTDAGGYAEDDDEDELDDNEMDGEAPTGAEGLATIAGFRLLLAKARGEITQEQAAEQAAAAGDKNKREEDETKRHPMADKKKQDEPVDHLARIMAAAEKTFQAAKQKSTPVQEEEKKRTPTSVAGPELDENGLPMVTCKSVWEPIWLNNGTITMKKLMQIFKISKKSKDRQNKFRECVKELCTMETDPMGGRMLVLKQHYSKSFRSL